MSTTLAADSSTGSATGEESRGRRAWLWVHLASLAVGFVVLLYANRNQWFWYDEWDFIARRGLHDPQWSLWRALVSLFKPADPEKLIAAKAATEVERKASLVPAEAPQRDKWPQELHVDGKQVLTKDGKPIWLQGVNVVSLEWKHRLAMRRPEHIERRETVEDRNSHTYV